MSGRVWIDERLALAVHQRMLVLDGGGRGVRDQGLLQSALARPLKLESYGAGAALEALAAALTFGIVKNHPFVDGNKRTGFVAGVLFLELNGARFTASEEAATEAILALAAGELDEAGYAAFIRANTTAV